jgi:hypothetical protein
MVSAIANDTVAGIISSVLFPVSALSRSFGSHSLRATTATLLLDGRGDEISLDEVERIGI